MLDQTLSPFWSLLYISLSACLTPSLPIPAFCAFVLSVLFPLCFLADVIISFFIPREY